MEAVETGARKCWGWGAARAARGPAGLGPRAGGNAGGRAPLGEFGLSRLAGRARLPAGLGRSAGGGPARARVAASLRELLQVGATFAVLVAGRSAGEVQQVAVRATCAHSTVRAGKCVRERPNERSARRNARRNAHCRPTQRARQSVGALREPLPPRGPPGGLLGPRGLRRVGAPLALGSRPGGGREEGPQRRAAGERQRETERERGRWGRAAGVGRSVGGSAGGRRL